MRALTIRQPWASLILSGAKPCELRSRPTRFRGRLYLHAGAHGARGADDGLPRGAIVGTAEVVDCVPVAELTGRERAALARLHPIPAGWYAWRLADVRPLARPIPAKGALGLWTPALSE